MTSGSTRSPGRWLDFQPSGLSRSVCDPCFNSGAASLTSQSSPTNSTSIKSRKWVRSLCRNAERFILTNPSSITRRKWSPGSNSLMPGFTAGLSLRTFAAAKTMRTASRELASPPSRNRSSPPAPPRLLPRCLPRPRKVRRPFPRPPSRAASDRELSPQRESYATTRQVQGKPTLSWLLT